MQLLKGPDLGHWLITKWERKVEENSTPPGRIQTHDLAGFGSRVVCSTPVLQPLPRHLVESHESSEKNPTMRNFLDAVAFIRKADNFIWIINLALRALISHEVGPGATQILFFFGLFVAAKMYSLDSQALQHWVMFKDNVQHRIKIPRTIDEMVAQWSPLELEVEGLIPAQQNLLWWNLFGQKSTRIGQRKGSTKQSCQGIENKSH